MWTLIGGAGAAAILSFISTSWLHTWLRRAGLVARPSRSRDVHQVATPRFGGLAIAFAFWLITLGFLIVAPNQIALTGQSVGRVDQNLFGVLLGTLIVVVSGLIDDYKGLGAFQKLFTHILGASMLPLFGVKIQWLANPLGGPNIILAPFVDGLLVIFWVVLVINVINLFDGLDGLAASLSSVALLVLALLALASFVHQPALALLLVIALGATLGFLPFNWHPAKIFLGDTGSQFLGFLIGTAAIISGGKLATAALVLSLPILDAAWAFVRRLAARRSPFAADRFHLHHRLLDLGLSQPVVVTLMVGLSAVFGMVALSSRTAGKVQAFGLIVLVMVVSLMLLSFAERRTRRSHKEIQ